MLMLLKFRCSCSAAKHRKTSVRCWPCTQDIEFTVQEGQLYMLQTRGGKRTGAAAVKIAVDLVADVGGTI